MGWIITGAVLLLIFIIIIQRVTVLFELHGGIFLDVSVAGVPIFGIPSNKKKKPKKSKRSGKKKKRKKKADDEEDSDKKKKKKKLPPLDDLLEIARLGLNALGKPLKRILKRTEFSHLVVDVTCGGEDAAKAAINYGAANFALGSALTLVDGFFTLKEPDELHIGVDFYEEKTDAKIYFEVRLSVAAALAFAFSLLGRAIKYYLTKPEARKAVKKLTAGE